MYKLVLILKYLRKRRIAWWSLLAVTLCTTMVLVVISVMGGWLNMFEHSFQGLSGDIVVESETLSGFPYYQEMIDRIKRVPNVQAAVPTISTFGIINIGNLKSDGVQVLGIPIDQIGQVNRFPQTLYLQYNQYIDQANQQKDPQKRRELLAEAAQHAAHPSFNLPLRAQDYRENLHMRNTRSDPSTYPGIILGSGLLEIHRESNGETVGRDPWKYLIPIKLTTIAVRPGEFGINPNDKNETIYWPADDSHTGLWQYDNNCVYVSFDELQKDLQMNAESAEDLETHKTIELPPRTSNIDIRVREGTELEPVRRQVAEVVAQVLAEHRDKDKQFYPQPNVQTWRQKQQTWIDAISHEKLLTVILFGIISVVAVFLVFCIFYMIVMEKTRDIGIIKSVGATSSGVAGIFLGYGLVIGLVGGLLGLLCSYLIVHNINQLHAMLGRLFHVQIWDPKVYLFDKIPNTMSWWDIGTIVPIAVVSSVLGALVPAMRAGSMNPVETLRWE